MYERLYAKAVVIESDGLMTVSEDLTPPIVNDFDLSANIIIFGCYGVG